MYVFILFIVFKVKITSTSNNITNLHIYYTSSVTYFYEIIISSIHDEVILLAKGEDVTPDI